MSRPCLRIQECRTTHEPPGNHLANPRTLAVRHNIRVVCLITLNHSTITHTGIINLNKVIRSHPRRRCVNDMNDFRRATRQQRYLRGVLAKQRSRRINTFVEFHINARLNTKRPLIFNRRHKFKLAIALLKTKRKVNSEVGSVKDTISLDVLSMKVQ